MKFNGQNPIDTKAYLIDFKDEPDNNFPFEGPRGNFLLSLLGSYGLLDKIRMGNWTIQGEEAITKDIEQCNPDVIIAFGKEAVSKFLSTSQSITEISGNVTDIKIGNIETKLLILPSPSYILNQMENSQAVLKYSQDLYKAFQIITGEYVDILKTKEILTAHSYEEFFNIFEKNFKNNELLSYDIETNARPPLTEGSKIIGFSLSNEYTGVYVSHDSLEFHMSKEDEDKIWEYFKKEVFDNPNRKVIIHNTMYERPYTLCCKNIEIEYEKAEDTLVMARLLKNPKETAGLKYQAQKILHYPDWETNLGKYINMINYLVDRICFGPKKFNALAQEIIINKISLDQIVITEAFTKLKDDDKKAFLDAIVPVLNILKDLYTPNEYRNLCALISEKVSEAYNQGGIQDSTIPYNWIPDKMLCQYGAVDAIATYDLYDYFIDFMNKESTDRVNLHQGYRNWLEHMYVACIMERNGIHFEDSLAVKDRKFLSDQATKSLRLLLTSPCFKDQIIDLCEENYKHIILADYLPEIAAQQGFKVEYDKVLDKYDVFKLTDKGTFKKVAKRTLNEIIIPDNYRKTYNELISTMFNEEVNNPEKDYEELKKYYNPSSSTTSYIPHKILLTPELQMSGRISLLASLANSPEFKDCIEKLPAIEQKFLKVAQLICDEKQLKATYEVDWVRYRKQLFESFCILYKNYKKDVTTKEIKTILNNKEPVEIEHFDDNGIITVYNNLVLMGIDPDDTSTWTLEFEWMINFRLFKKSAKIITSYIDGSVGHQMVKVVNRKDMEESNHRLIRKRDYDPNISEDEMHLMNSKWGPNTADTGRWRSAIHTLPWNSPVKKYYTSRFKHGSTLCPDYCLTGDTKIRLLDGRQETLENLYNNGETEFEVYSYDIDTKKVVVGSASNLCITKKTKEIYEIILDNGHSIKCTGNHPFLALDGTYIKAEDLAVGTSLQPCNFRYSTDRILEGYEQLDNGIGEWVYTHHVSSDQVNPIPPRKSQLYRHHINGNKLDNRTSNLEIVSASKHMSHHMKEYHETHKEEFSEMQKARWTEEMRVQFGERTKKMWENPEYREFMREISLTHGAEAFRKSNHDPRCIELRKEGKDNNTKQCIEETFAKVVLSGVIISEYTWDKIIDDLGLRKKGCTGNSLKNIRRVYGTFMDFVNSMIKFIPKQYYDEVKFRTEFENKVGPKRSQTFKIYFNNFETIGLLVTEDTWENCIMILRDRRDIDGIKVVDPYHLPYLKQIINRGATFDDLKRYSRLNHRVVEIKIHQLDKEIPVYDLQVDKYHNFLVCTGIDSGIFVHNSTMEVRTLAAISKDENMLELFHKGADFHTETAKKIFKKDEITSAERRFSKAATFSLLYGSSVSSFAKSYCNNDIDYANMIFDGFFEAYPNVKKWIEARHEEVQRDNRVSLELSNRFISIPLEGSGVGAENARLRKAQNFPIQGQSADLTGGVIFDLQKWLEQEKLKSCVIMYVHDSIEVDVPPEELLKVISKFKVLLNKSPMERMGLPSKADVALGKSLGHEIELKDLKTNEEMTEGWLTLEGYKDEIDETVDNWRGAYSILEISDEDYKDEFISMGELFIPKKAYSPSLGTMRHHGTCKVHIKY